MLRWTVSLAVLVAMLVSSTELMAQRRTPVRNLFRSFGNGWNAGNHWQNPGWNSNYYSNWSDINTSQQFHQDGLIIEGTPPQAPQQIHPPANTDNSASRILQSQPGNIYPNSSHQIPASPSINTPWSNTNPASSSTTIDRTWSDNQRINRHLTPYHQPSTSNSSIQIPSGGQFQSPRNIPNNNIQNNNWDSRYNQQFNSSRPFRPGT